MGKGRLKRGMKETQCGEGKDLKRGKGGIDRLKKVKRGEIWRINRMRGETRGKER